MLNSSESVHEDIRDRDIRLLRRFQSFVARKHPEIITEWLECPKDKELEK